MSSILYVCHKLFVHVSACGLWPNSAWSLGFRVDVCFGHSQESVWVVIKVKLMSELQAPPPPLSSQHEKTLKTESFLHVMQHWQSVQILEITLLPLPVGKLAIHCMSRTSSHNIDLLGFVQTHRNGTVSSSSLLFHYLINTHFLQ